MTHSDRTEAVTTRDGGSMPAFVATPASDGGPGVVVLQEIFGVTDYLKRRARDLANLGYVAMVPQLYWRLGSDIDNQLQAASEITAPIIFHFGDNDQFLPLDEANRIAATFSERPTAEVHMHAGAGHAFDNPSPMFHNQDASEEAWPQTATFLQ